ncbi:hypothetical protein HanPI659440_Chr17g0675911 [Helianthus annuus]|nr:hypothetical protein HanPI659440_Chr17g0675911 [Helianthus annuus]
MAHPMKPSAIIQVTLLLSSLLVVSISSSSLRGMVCNIDKVSLRMSLLSSHGSNPSGIETICTRSPKPSLSKQLPVTSL